MPEFTVWAPNRQRVDLHVDGRIQAMQQRDDGWWHAVDEDTKSKYVVQALQYARANYSGWLAAMNIWAFSDPAWTPNDEQYWWAITNPDGTPRAAKSVL